MKRTRHTPEQVIRKLRDAERMLAEGKDLQEVCRRLEISVQTYHRWQKQYQGFQRRGRAAVCSEWRLAAATHNLLKLHQHRIAAGGA